MGEHVKNGDLIRMTITDFSTNGEGIGHADGCTLFVAGALIGDEIEVRITHMKKTYGYGQIKTLITPSPYRVKPRCPVSTKCGGCTLQNLAYDAQLAFKKNLVENDLKRLGGLDLPVNDVIGMEAPWHYRNKSQYPVGRDRRGNPIAGFYAGRSHEIVPMRSCAISAEIDELIVGKVLAFMKDYDIPPYDEKTGEGLVRHILVRKGCVTGEVMACLIVNGRRLPQADKLVEALKTVPGLVSVCLNVNTRRSNVILGNEVLPLLGDPFITDYIGDLAFRISPLSFYQINPVQTKKLYDTVKMMADLKGYETVLDLYCGIGTIGLYLADRADSVHGVEIVPQAIKDARENAVRNGVTNASFSVGASEDIFKDLPKADVVILDPPRKGCEESLLHELAAQKPERIVYVSCNPATLARDLKVLTACGYRVDAVQPVDMFPHTTHIENVVRLSLL
ncbi:MAG: 23S rRNA (uracil(1939)-C(5))-methyltransferase RlmD [Lachnospiraceae bacterium]|nr:23S rRNA (uracil(1939)-C(5))-methyltransferase RlmD [Lachnospiraceae bacterium]